MFVNEYVMTRKRYDKWAAPKFWRLPIFYVYCVIFASGTFGWIYFHHVGASLRWQSVGATLSFIAIYRGVFFKWMHADKTFRVMRTQYFNDKDWTCKVKFRDDLGEHFVITKGMENCLYVYPEAEWTAFEEKLNALPTTTDKKARAFAYFFQGSAADGDLDKQGRTLIPSVLRTFAHLDKEVVFIGMGKRAEIWDKARWDEKNAEVELNIEDIASDMEESGFSI